MTTISPIVNIPVSTDSRSTFNTKTDALFYQLNDFATQANIVGAEITAGSVSVAASVAAGNASVAANTALATSAASQANVSASVALAAANYKGLWSGLTGALNIPACVYHTNSFWILKQNLANVTTATPSVGSAYWELASGKVLTSEIKLAAVASAFPTLTFKQSIFHLAKDDTDKGAWRKRKGQSWRSEARSLGKHWGSYATATLAVAVGAAVGDVYYNTTSSAFHEVTGATTSTATYRAGTEDYPTNAAITIESGRLIIWDLDGAVPTMWRVISGYSSTAFIFDGVATACSSVTAINNIIAVGVLGNLNYGGGLICNFLSDYVLKIKGTHSGSGYGIRSFSSPNATSWENANNGTKLQLASGASNGVAITILPDAPQDEFGMPIPNIALATAGGVSEIRNDGTVVNSLSTTSAYGISYDELNRIRWNTTTEYNCSPVAPRAASFTASSVTEPKLSYAAYSSSNVPISPAIATGTGKSVKGAIASTNGLTLYKAGQSSNALFAAVTSVYNTGWRIGDESRCFLANSKTADRSIKAGTLVEVGTVTETTYSGGRSVYSGFTSGNYLQEASNADWNALGTGDFSIKMSAVKWGTAGVSRAVFSMGDGVSAGSVILDIYSLNTLRMFIHGGVAMTDNYITTGATFTDTAEHTLEVKRTSGVVSIVVDGISIAYTTNAGSMAASISNATGYLRIGDRQGASVPWVGGQCACVSISATPTTAEQSKLIAAQENALNGGQACLLSNSASVSALAYDEVTKTYLVGNGTAVDKFVGLKRISTQAHGVTTLTSLAAANGRNLIVGTGGSYSAPERNISAELLEQQVTTPRTQQYAFTTPAATTTQALPKGWKAQGIQFNLTDSTIASPTQTFDGFLWTLSGLTASKSYQINLVEVL